MKSIIKHIVILAMITFGLLPFISAQNPFIQDGRINLFSVPKIVKNSRMISISIKQFGARGDGKTDDTPAFLEAAAFINKRGGNTHLVIPNGKYLVGGQIDRHSKKYGMVNSQFYLQGIDVFKLLNCKSVIIEGGGLTQIFYRGQLKFGSFAPNTRRPLGRITQENDKAAYIGSFIFLDKCKDVEIKLLQLDGNAKNVDLGSEYGDKGFQLPFYGIKIFTSERIFVHKVDVKDFGTDGIILAGINGVYLNQIKVNLSGRNALSWVGGKNLFVANSSFNKSGMGKVKSAPGAGLDIEPEDGNCESAIFENCEFADNLGAAYVSDIGPAKQGKLTVKNIRFYRCQFVGLKTYAIWPFGIQADFDECNIFGTCINPFGMGPREQVRFRKCYFEDKVGSQQEHKPGESRLMESSAGINNYYYTVSNCTFVSNRAGFVRLDLGTPHKGDVTFENNTFILKTNARTTCNDLFFIAYFTNCHFRNNMFIDQSDKKERAFKYIIESSTTLSNNNNTIKDFGNSRMRWNNCYTPGDKF